MSQRFAARDGWAYRSKWVSHVVSGEGWGYTSLIAWKLLRSFTPNSTNLATLLQLPCRRRTPAAPAAAATPGPPPQPPHRTKTRKITTVAAKTAAVREAHSLPLLDLQLKTKRRRKRAKPSAAAAAPIPAVLRGGVRRSRRLQNPVDIARHHTRPSSRSGATGGWRFVVRRHAAPPLRCPASQLSLRRASPVGHPEVTRLLGPISGSETPGVSRWSGAQRDGNGGDFSGVTLARNTDSTP